MLAALSVIDKTEKNKLKHLLNIIRGNKMTVTIKQARGVTLRHMEYYNRNGKIDWNVIEKYAGVQKKGLLCSKYLNLPENMGFERFEDLEFSRRLCTNMALYILEKVSEVQGLKVCLYDVQGDSADVLIHILEHCPEARVYTENADVYADSRDVVMENTGISPIISSDESIIEDADFLIAPCVIQKTLPLRNSAITLTAACPKAEQRGAIYFRYHFKIPQKFAGIKPCELSDFYFTSALYTLAGQHQLGSIVPMLCSNYSSGARLEAICAYFNSRA